MVRSRRVAQIADLDREPTGRRELRGEARQTGTSQKTAPAAPSFASRNVSPAPPKAPPARTPQNPAPYPLRPAPCALRALRPASFLLRLAKVEATGLETRGTLGGLGGWAVTDSMPAISTSRSSCRRIFVLGFALSRNATSHQIHLQARANAQQAPRIA